MSKEKELIYAIRTKNEDKRTIVQYLPERLLPAPELAMDYFYVTFYPMNILQPPRYPVLVKDKYGCVGLALFKNNRWTSCDFPALNGNSPNFRHITEWAEFPYSSH